MGAGGGGGGEEEEGAGTTLPKASFKKLSAAHSEQVSWNLRAWTLGGGVWMCGGLMVGGGNLGVECVCVASCPRARAQLPSECRLRCSSLCITCRTVGARGKVIDWATSVSINALSRRAESNPTIAA